MNKLSRSLLIFITLITVIAAPPAIAGDAGDCATVVSVAAGAYLRLGKPGIMFEDTDIANSSFIIGKTAVAVIDTGGSPAEGAVLLCAIRQRTQLPIAYVITTHVHPDHQLGNSAFRSETGVQFIGHQKLKQATALLGPTYLERFNTATADTGTAKMVLNDLTTPDLSVENVLEVNLGERPLRIMSVAQAHTNNDLIVLDETSGTLWLGDLLFSDHIPVLGGSGSVNGWLKLLPTLKQTPGVKQFVPGHGAVQAADTPAIALETAYLSEMRDAVRQWIAEDKPLAEALTGIGATSAQQWPMAETFHQRNISYMYSELEWE